MSKFTNMGETKKYGIKMVSLNEYFPSFIDDSKNQSICWQEANKDICGRVQTFLIVIAKIKLHSFKCYCCIYPHSSSAEYTVFVDINLGNLCLLLTTIRDPNPYPNSGQRIQMLKDDLLLLDAPQDLLISLRQGMPDLLHPGE